MRLPPPTWQCRIIELHERAVPIAMARSALLSHLLAFQHPLLTRADILSLEA
jgi:hypothetical protein